MKEIAYSGYNQLTCDRICEYLEARDIDFKVSLKNPAMAALVRNKTIIKVKKGVLTDDNRQEIQAIINSSTEF